MQKAGLQPQPIHPLNEALQAVVQKSKLTLAHAVVPALHLHGNVAKKEALYVRLGAYPFMAASPVAATERIAYDIFSAKSLGWYCRHHSNTQH